MEQQPYHPEQRHPGSPPPLHPVRPLGPPSWFKVALVFMGICTPGGFLFLLALITESNINFDKPVWFILAAIGGVAGWLIGRKASR